jgi:predicted RNA-binding protein with RPS1 domain
MIPQNSLKVVGVDKEKERISLSRKALLPNPWEKLAEKYKAGDLIEGTIVAVLDFGAFVELQEGLQGLIHVSEIGYATTEKPSDVVKKGDRVLVRIMAIEPARERVSLSMRRVPVSEQMDWMMNLEDAKEGFLVDGGVIEAGDQEPGGDSASEGLRSKEKQTAEDQDKTEPESKETSLISSEKNDLEEESAIEENSPGETTAGDV